MHISKIRFLFPVSFTIEYKVGVAEFYLYMGFGADLLKNMVTKPDKNSPGDEIANVNFFYNIAHVEASAYAH